MGDQEDDRKVVYIQTAACSVHAQAALSLVGISKGLTFFNSMVE